MNARQRHTVTARCSNPVGERLGYKFLVGHNNIHSYRGMCLFICVMHAVYARSAISLVKPVNSESQIHAQKRKPDLLNV